MGMERPIGLLIIAHFLVTTAQAKIQCAPILFSDIPWTVLRDMGAGVSDALGLQSNNHSFQIEGG